MKRAHFIIYCLVTGLALAAVGGAWALDWVDFFAPIWLLALFVLPLLAAVAVTGISGLPSRTNAISLAIRTFLFILLILGLAEIQKVRRNDGLNVLFLLDHSASIPQAVVDRELDYVNKAAATKGKKDLAGIVVFGENASVEQTAEKSLKIERLWSFVGKDFTDLQGAVELAAAALPADARKKIVLITDGNENKGNLLDGVRFAAANQVVTEILPVTYEYEREVVVEKLQLPDKIKEHETFDMRVHVSTQREGPAELAIFRNGVRVASETLNLKKGRNTYTASLKIDEPGFYSFSARITSAQDTIKQNNEATGYVYIQGSSRILLVAPTSTEVAHLAAACRADNLETDVIAPEDLPASLGMIQNHDCVILANVSADQIAPEKLAVLRAAVRDLGIGLIMIGGENSFGAGNYGGTPVEEALPVTMDVKQKKINPKGALVLVLHTCEFDNGNYWAKEITKKAIETVNTGDDVGVLLYDGSERWLFPLKAASDKIAMYREVDRATPGDMPSFAPTLQLAFNALSKSEAMVRHVIIISDGDPAGPSPQLIKDMGAAGITISTVGINPHSPRDVDVLKYLAQTTGGRFYLAQDPAALPQIFVKEAKVVKRSLIFNQKFQPLLVLQTEVTKGIAAADLPPLMAYVATTPKDRALVPITSDNENHDPIFAYWQFGLGKSAAFMSDASANWGKQWVAWDKYGKFWTQVVRWAARKREKTNLNMYTEITGGRGKLVIDAIDAQGRFINFLKLNGRMVDPENEGAALDIRQTAPGRYEALFEARKVGVSIANVGYQDPQTGAQGFMAAGVAVPYSREYQEFKSNIPLLQRAAVAGGGRLLTGKPEIDRVFRSRQPPTRLFRPLWEELLLAGLLLFLLDVAIRRVIITRDDLSAAAGAVRARIPFGRRAAGPRDETMSALLNRKQKTFERAEGAKQAPAPAPAAEADGGFKARLEKEAGRKEPAGQLQVDSAAAGEVAAEAGPARPEAAQTKEHGEQSYTDRLLAAKKRAGKM